MLTCVPNSSKGIARKPSKSWLSGGNGRRRNPKPALATDGVKGDRWAGGALAILDFSAQAGASAMSQRRHHSLPLLLAAVPLCLLAVSVCAAENPSRGPSEVIFLLQIIALLGCGRLIGELMQRIGQPPVMGQLLAGIMLGPSVLGAVWPALQHSLFPTNPDQKAMIDALAQLGILLLLLLTAMETDLAVVRRSRRAAFSVSIAGIVVPFLCGILLGDLLPDTMLPNPEKRLITTLFLGTALSISSVKIVAMVVREAGFLRRTVGQ